MLHLFLSVNHMIHSDPSNHREPRAEYVAARSKPIVSRIGSGTPIHSGILFATVFQVSTVAAGTANRRLRLSRSPGRRGRRSEMRGKNYQIHRPFGAYQAISMVALDPRRR